MSLGAQSSPQIDAPALIPLEVS